MPPAKINSENSRRSASSETEYQKIADHLTTGKPLAWAVRFDGSLSVVSANGQKFIFSKEEVDQAHQQLKARQKPSGRPKTASKPK